MKIIFVKLELWFVLLLGIITLALCVLFASVVRHYYLDGDKLGKYGVVIKTIAEFPLAVREVLKFTPRSADSLAKEQRFEGRSGFKFNYKPGEKSDLGYLLLNRFDADIATGVTELWDLRDQKKIHSWDFKSINNTWKETKFESEINNFRVDSASYRFRSAHAIIDDDGEIITHGFGAPMVMADKCSLLKIFQDSQSYHHSIERDKDGNYWVPSRIEPKSVDLGRRDFMDDGVTQIAPTGEIIFKKSVIQMLDDNGLGYYIYGLGEANRDPIHLNDIQPVFEDGKYWKAGDLFLSLRNLSMIILYRPSNNTILWHQQGPWMAQHDVNVLSDNQISIFNNNTALSGTRDWHVRDRNDVVVYDFDTKTITSPWAQAMKSNDIRTVGEGRSTIIGSSVVIEESDYGRLLQFDSKGEIEWEFINRAADGKLYVMNWSRMIERAAGDKIQKKLKQGKVCLQ